MKDFKNQAKVLRHYRIKKKMSQTELSEAVGCHKQLISNMERGLCGITRFKVQKIMSTLKIPKAKVKKAYLQDAKNFVENYL